MLRGLTAVCLAFLTFASAFAQPENGVSQPQEQAFFFAVNMKALDRDEKVVASKESSKTTISGQPIVIKLDGKTIKGLMVYTIYAIKDKPLLLLAQGQFWVREKPNAEAEYVTILKSIPFVLGEMIEFYPLGKGAQSTDNILMEITITQSLEDAVKNKPPKKDLP